MRPIRLEIQGFACYRDHTELDLSTLNLFAITGPTGSGKSSLIDAMTYALYGRVPRVGTEVKDCIAQGMDGMRVGLEFDVDSRHYRVFRSTSRKGPAGVQLEHLEDGKWAPLEGRAREATERIERLLGLDFHAFTRSVLLPQGQFDQFLAGKPEERRRILSELLRTGIYERIAKAAGQIAREARGQADALARRLREDYAQATEEALRARELEAQGLRDAVERLEAAHKYSEEALGEARKLAEARKKGEEARNAHAEALRLHDEARRVLDEGEKELEERRKDLARLEGALASNQYDDQLFARLTGALQIAHAVSDLDAKLAGGAEKLAQERQRLTTAEAAAQSKASAVETTSEERTAAERRLQDAQREHAAVFLRRSLEPGDLCPVCGQPVHDVPPSEHSHLEEAQAHLKSLREREQAARNELAAAEKAFSLARQQHDTLRGQIEGWEREREAKTQGLAALQLPLEPTAEAIQALRMRQDKAREEREALRREQDAQQDEYRQKNDRLSQARRDEGALAQRVQGASEAATQAEAEADLHLGTLCDRARAASWTDALETLEAGGDASVILEERLRACEGDLRAHQDRLAIAQESIKKLRQDIVKRAELVEEEQGIRERESVARDLADLLRADRFTAYVHQEALRLLAEDGSKRLEELSAGRYAFAVDGDKQEFLVVDHWNASETRPVKTLSGGETFLASLALAQALAERLPEMGGGASQAMLESLFLDEGFGALDEETLDTVALAIESLHSKKRLVCIITHIPQLADRMPARIDVSKSESGSRLQVGP